MYYKILIIVLAGLNLIHCVSKKNISKEKAEIPTSTEIKQDLPKDNIIYFSEGENRFLPEYQMNVTFKNISEDSRCPKGTQCVWAGVAVANIELLSTTSRPATLAFSTINVSGKNYQKTRNFSGYNITLEEVSPYPDHTNGQKKFSGKYRIGISITKENNQQNSTTK